MPEPKPPLARERICKKTVNMVILHTFELQKEKTVV